MRIKVLIQFGSSEMMFVELGANTTYTVCVCISIKCSYSHVQNTPQKHRQSMRLRFITFGMRIKALIQFGSCETMFVELIMRANTIYELCTVCCI